MSDSTMAMKTVDGIAVSIIPKYGNPNSPVRNGADQVHFLTTDAIGYMAEDRYGYEGNALRH